MRIERVVPDPRATIVFVVNDATGNRTAVVLVVEHGAWRLLRSVHQGVCCVARNAAPG